MSPYRFKYEIDQRLQAKQTNRPIKGHKTSCFIIPTYNKIISGDIKLKHMPGEVKSPRFTLTSPLSQVVTEGRFLTWEPERFHSGPGSKLVKAGLCLSKLVIACHGTATERMY